MPGETTPEMCTALAQISQSHGALPLFPVLLLVMIPIQGWARVQLSQTTGKPRGWSRAWMQPIYKHLQRHPWPQSAVLSSPLLCLRLLLLLCSHLRASGAKTSNQHPSSISQDGNGFPAKQKQC